MIYFVTQPQTCVYNSLSLLKCIFNTLSKVDPNFVFKSDHISNVGLSGKYKTYKPKNKLPIKRLPSPLSFVFVHRSPSEILPQMPIDRHVLRRLPFFLCHRLRLV